MIIFDLFLLVFLMFNYSLNSFLIKFKSFHYFSSFRLKKAKSSSIISKSFISSKNQDDPNNSIIKPEFIKFLERKVSISLENWIPKDFDRTIYTNYIIQSLLTKISDSPHIQTASEYRKAVYKESESYCYALKQSPGELSNLIDDSYISTLIENQMNNKIKNEKMFSTIQSHHNKLKLDSAVDSSAHSSYSIAAKDMGDKLWVQNVNKWVGNFSVSYFKMGGARREYLKFIDKKYKEKHSTPLSIDNMKSFTKILPKNIMPKDKIRKFFLKFFF